MNYENCPNCNKSLNGFFSADLHLESKVNFINKHLKQDKNKKTTKRERCFSIFFKNDFKTNFSAVRFL